MKNFLLLKDGKEQSDELVKLFHREGYQVTQIDGIKSCSKYLLSKSTGNSITTSYAEVPFGSGRGITILNAQEADTLQDSLENEPDFSALIVSLARRLTPGWRLNLRHRILEAPNQAKAELTSLEFSFVKMFALVDPGESVSRKKIVQEFGEDYLSYDQNRLDTMVRRLRKKVEASTGLRLPLNTVRVRGFAFDDVLIIDI